MPKLCCFYLLFFVSICHAQLPKLVLPLGHTAPITDISISNDNRLLATASKDHTVKIWDISTGFLLSDLKGHSEEIRSVKLSDDGQTLLSASVDGSAKLWNIFSGQVIHDFREDYFADIYTNYSHKGNRIITSVNWYQKSISKIFDAVTGNEIIFFEDPVQITSQVFSTTDDYVLLFTDEGTGILRSVSDTGFKILIPNIQNAESSILMLSGKQYEVSVNENNIKITSSEISIVFEIESTYRPGKKFLSKDKTTSISIHRSGLAIIMNAQAVTKVNLFGHTRKFNQALYSSDGNSIITASGDGAARIWDVSTGRLSQTINTSESQLLSSQFDNSGKRILALSSNGNLHVFHSDSLRTVLKIEGENIKSAAFSPDGKYVIAASNTNMLFWDLNSENINKEITIDGTEVSLVKFNNDGSRIMAASGQSIYLFDSSGKRLFEVAAHEHAVTSIDFSPDNNFIISGSFRSAKVWDASTGNFIRELKKEGGYMYFLTSVQFDPSGTKILTAQDDSISRIWDFETGEMIFELRGHASAVVSAQFNKEGDKILTASNDNTCKVWNAASGKLIYTFFSLDSNDYLNFISSGHYQGTRNASRLLHYVTPELKVISFDQLDLHYNRPDILHAALGNKDTSLIVSYKKAWLKRLRKLDIDSSSTGIAVPQADFLNRSDVNSFTSSPTVKLHITGNDSIHLLDRFNIWVNGNPLFGMRGFSFSNPKNNFDTIITVRLTEGNNLLETSVLNSKGNESFRMPLRIFYPPQSNSTTKLHFLGIGIDKFKESTNNLNYCVKDIRDLCKTLRSKYGNNIIIDTLFNKDVTVENILAFRKKLGFSTENDKVIIAYSGHGLLNKEHDYFLSTYNINFNEPEENGLSYDAFESLLDSIPARKKLMLIDACHSGEVDKETMEQYERMLDEKKKEGMKGSVILLKKKDKSIGMKNSFDLMREIFIDIGKRTGANIISAAAGTQFAIEKHGLNNGVFTFSILEFLKSGEYAAISALKQYVNRRVSFLTNGLQVPTSRSENFYADWSIW